MQISKLAIDRPIFTIMVSLIVILLGAISLSRLPVDLMPDITYPTLSIRTSYKNASPEEIEELITRPIEEAMSAVPGVEEVTSISTEGSSSVRVTFVWGTDLDVAANDIRDRLDRIISRLPDEAEKPSLRKFDLASFPVLILGASGDLDPIQMRRIIDTQVKFRIERVPGVASIDVFGGLDREIHVNLHLDRIKGLDLSLEDILKRIRAENVNIPAGTFKKGNLEVLVRTPGQYASLDELKDTIVDIREGAPIKIRDIAEVEDSWEKVTRIVRINGIPGINLGVYKQSGKNTVAVAKEALREIEKINEEISQINLTPIIDTSDYINRSIKNVGFAAIYGGILAILVLLFFLGSFQSTAIIGTAIPISIIATFALIYFGGFTLNLMTLGGLALGVGMLVDNAIVVLENIYRFRQSGVDPYQSAIKGSEEVTAAIIASTLTTLAVFLPTIFIRGMSGIMFKQMAYVVCFSLLCSLVVALSLVPMLSSKMLHLENNGSKSNKNFIHKLLSMSRGFIDQIEANYRYLLHYSLDHRKIFVGGIILVLLLSLALIPLIGVELMPTADEGEVRVNVEMEVGTRIDVISEKFKTIESIVTDLVPEAKNISTRIGGGWRSSGAHTGQMRITLVPISERTRSSAQIAVDLRRNLSDIPGLKIRTREGQGLFILRMGTSEGDKVQIEIRGHDLSIADALSQKVTNFVEQVKGITDVQNTREAGSPEELIIVDRSKAADMKLTVSQIADALQTILSGTQAGNYREAGDEYKILVKLYDSEQIEMKDVLDLTLINADGEPVVLRNVVSIQPRKGPVRIERKNQERIVQVSANISGRDMGSVLTDIREKLKSLPIPRDFSISYGGEYEEQQKSFKELLISFLLAILLVYMVMACQFESLRDPFVVMFSVPLAIIGVILILFLTDTTFNIQAFIGCIMLGGIVVNNAILLVDHTNLLRRRDNMPLRQAIEEACLHRLRPVLMTAMTTILGLVPLAIGIGEGGEAQAPLARAVIGGLFSSTLITLVLIPIVYSIFERLRPKKIQGIGILCIIFIFTIAGISTISPNLIYAKSLKDPNNVIRDLPYKEESQSKPLEISIENSITMALENNHSFRVERMKPKIQRTFEDQERAVFDPILKGEIKRSQEKEESIDYSNNDPNNEVLQYIDNKINQTETQLEISKSFATGTNISLGLSTDREWSHLYEDQHTSHAGLSITQALLKGAGIRANMVGLRKAKLDTLYSEHEFRAFVLSLISRVEETYWDYALAQQQINIYTESLSLAEQQMKETEERIKIGVLSEIELAASRAEVALRKEDLINARSNLARLKLKLLYLINSTDSNLCEKEIILLDHPAVPNIKLDDVESHVAVALKMRPDLNQAKLLLKKGELEIVKTKNGLLPKMDLFITLGKSGYSDSFLGSWKDIDKEIYNIYAGISLEYPLSNRGAKAQHRRALLNQDQYNEALKNLAQIVQLDVRTAYIEVKRTSQQVFATAATRKLQQEKMRSETEKFRVGKSTSFLVAQTQRDLIASKISEIQSTVGYLNALIELYRLEGSLLERRGVVLFN